MKVALKMPRIGMNMEEIAEVLGVSRNTVANGWRAARAWLNLHIQEDPQP